MDPGSVFTGTLLRLVEAENQREQFRRKWASHLATVPWEFSLESDTPLHHRLMGHERRPVPAGLGLHFSMWLQQQRAALDNALYACMGVRQGSFPPARENLLEFPIADSPAKFRGTKSIKNGAVDEEISEFLEAYQPYRRHYLGEEQNPHLSPLYWLNELARIDRHRVMHVGVGSIQISRDLFLYGGAEHKVTHLVGEGHILTGSTCVVGFSTVQPLRSRKFRFLNKPQILPEIADWSSAESNILVLGDWHDPDPAKRTFYVQGYVPLYERMAGIEDLVIEICGGLAIKAGLTRQFFSGVSSSRYSVTPHQKKRWADEAAQRRRVNGL